jgi:prepilin peptidase CpaA
MMLGPQLIPLTGFAVLMAAAAIEDFRRLVIPNPLILVLCGFWVLRLEAAGDIHLAAALAAAGCALAVFLAGAVLFARGLIGGGDVKLLSAAALWAGADGVALLLAVAGLLGGVLALALLTPLGARFSAQRRAAADPVGAGRVPVPYGVAIAAAALIVTICPQLG